MKSLVKSICLLMVLGGAFVGHRQSIYAQTADESESSDTVETLDEQTLLENPAYVFSNMVLNSSISEATTQAVQEYIAILDQITYRDLASKDLEGTTMEEASELELTGDYEEFVNDSGLTTSIYSYGEAPSAEVVLIFADNHLAYSGFMNLELLFGSTPPSDESIDHAVIVGTSIAKYESLAPYISGVGQMFNNGEFITSNFLHTGSSFTNLTGNIVLFDEEAIIYFVRAPFQNILGNAQYRMFEATHRFVQTGEMTDFEESLEAY
ncbi:hypothetical protein [Fundicoccus culcitae]|uniref:DUF3298 domain-containing protein n=1 Tax=Fundicoccus culcitae TaxID=2969821 RepID=A0ABY5P501_9LACT|nr:hypothetical protein [Fundicoccus culcitae]UUX33685.1 hypothetical protein NRE15_12370 [Fundicoccus culcitae]